MSNRRDFIKKALGVSVAAPLTRFAFAAPSNVVGYSGISREDCEPLLPLPRYPEIVKRNHWNPDWLEIHCNMFRISHAIASCAVVQASDACGVNIAQAHRYFVCEMPPAQIASWREMALCYLKELEPKRGSLDELYRELPRTMFGIPIRQAAGLTPTEFRLVDRDGRIILYCHHLAVPLGFPITGVSA